MYRKKIVSALLLVSAVVLSACSTAANARRQISNQAVTVKIGVNLELSGRVASYGNPMLEAIQLAVAEKNAAGGVLGKSVELVSLDNKSDTKESASVATSLAEKGVIGILGPATTSDSLAQIPVATKTKIPVVLPAATGDNVVKDSSGNVLDYIYRVAYSDSFQGKAIAQFSNETLQAKRVVVLKDTSSDYAKGLSEAFIKHYSGDIVTTENFQSGDTDFNAILTKIKSLPYDAILIAGYYEEAGLIIKQARQMGIDRAILGGDGLASETLVELAGTENVNKVFYTNHFTTLSKDEKVQHFLKAYREKYNKEADAFAALAYDAAGVLMAAIETVGEMDSVKVAKELANVKDYEGVTGKFSVDENHNVVKSTFVLELVNGKEANYTVVEPK